MPSFDFFDFVLQTLEMMLIVLGIFTDLCIILEFWKFHRTASWVDLHTVKNQQEEECVKGQERTKQNAMQNLRNTTITKFLYKKQAKYWKIF